LVLVVTFVMVMVMPLIGTFRSGGLSTGQVCYLFQEALSVLVVRATDWIGNELDRPILQNLAFDNVLRHLLSLSS